MFLRHVNPGQSKSLLDWFATFVVQLDIFIEFGLNVNVPGLKSPHWNIEFRIWAKCTGVWGKITPTKLAVFIKLYPTSEARMLHSKILPQTSKKFTQINLPYLWHFGGMFPRVFGDEFGDKFGDEFGDKFSELPNLVIILVMNLVMNLVNCQIRWQFGW